MSQDRSRIQDILSDQLTELQSISAIRNPPKEIEYDGTYYVSIAGDNSDGLTWSTAFTAIASALNLIEANQITGENHLILLGVGTFDVNVTGNPTYTANIFIQGAGYGRTTVVNNHVGATAILRFTGHSGLKELTVYTGATGSKSGVIVDGGGTYTANGFVIEKVWIIGYSADGAMDCLLFNNAVAYAQIKDCLIYGDNINSTAIHFKNVQDVFVTNTFVMESAIGVHLESAVDDDNKFFDLYVGSNAVGIQIDNAIASNNCFDRPKFFGNTINITDNGTANFFGNYCTYAVITQLIPETASAGVTVVSKNVADTYADNYSQIDDGSGFTKPFLILGAFLGNPSDNTATYILKIAVGEAGSEVDIARFMHQSDKFTAGSPVPIESGLLPAGTRVSANCQTENAVADDIEIWLLYAEV